MSSLPNDAALIELMIAYQAGDLTAFEQLYAILAGEIRGYFVRMHRDAGMAGDLVQDVFLELHRSRRTYTPPLPVRPWVYGIARNVAARGRRAARAHPEARMTLDLEVGESPVVHAPSAEALDVGNALDALPPSTRDAFVLHHVLGFSFRAIAERLGVTEMAAKLRSSRAMRALRTALRSDDE